MQIGHWFPLYCLVVMEYWQRGPTGLLSKTGLMIALDRHSVMIARQLLVKTTVWRQEIYCWKLNSTGRSQLGTHHYHCTTITPTSLAIWHDTTNCTALHLVPPDVLVIYTKAKVRLISNSYHASFSIAPCCSFMAP